MVLVYLIAMVVYGLARATQQSVIFMFKNHETPPEWTDESKEIHFFGWFEPLSLSVASYVLLTRLSGHGFVNYIVFAFVSYFLYWYPYACLFNFIRGREWFLANKYQILGFTFTLLGEKMTAVMFYISVFYTIGWWLL